MRALTGSSMRSKHSRMTRISPSAPGWRRNRGGCMAGIGTARPLPLLLRPECPNPGGKSTNPLQVCPDQPSDLLDIPEVTSAYPELLHRGG